METTMTKPDFEKDVVEETRIAGFRLEEATRRARGLRVIGDDHEASIECVINALHASVDALRALNERVSHLEDALKILNGKTDP